MRNGRLQNPVSEQVAYVPWRLALFGLALLALGPGRAKGCPPGVFERLINRTEARARVKSLFPYLQPVVLAVTRDYRARGENRPFVFNIQEKESQFIALEAETPKYFAGVTGTSPDPYRAKVQEWAGEPRILEELPAGKFFKPYDTGADTATDVREDADAVRRYLAVTTLAEAMGANTVLRSELAVVQGRWGILQEKVNDQVPPIQDLHAALSPRSYSDTQAFEFLVGNWDTPFNTNFTLSEKGDVRVYDHDKAFSCGIPHDNFEVFTGLFPPEQYTPKFEASLRALTDDILREKLGRALTPNELFYVRVRRDIMLKDIELRGAEARMN